MHSQKAAEFTLEEFKCPHAGWRVSQMRGGAGEEIVDFRKWLAGLGNEIGELSEVAAEEKIRGRACGKNLEESHFAKRVQGSPLGRRKGNLRLVEEVQAASKRTGGAPSCAGHGGDFAMPAGEPCGDETRVAPRLLADEDSLGLFHGCLARFRRFRER